MVRPKPELLLAIGGLPRTEQEKLAEELGVSFACACDIWYLRTRSRWTEDLEQELIQAHARGETVDINSFGVTAETQASLYWKVAKEIRDNL